MTAPSGSAEEALSHLKGLRPLGGWNVESKGGAFRLLRRKIPLTDSFFLDIHLDKASGCVVGILSKPKRGKAQGQIIVDKEGSPASITKADIIDCSDYDPNKKKKKSTASSATAKTSSTTRSAVTTTEAESILPTLSEEDNKKLLQYALYAVVAATILKMLTQAMMTVSLLLVPCLYLYALQCCPAQESFDAKKELRRILRGHHLPENDPNKPKGWLGQTMARVNAAVTTELATGLGYEVDMMNIGGAAWFTSVKVPTTAMEFYWVGAFNKWFYIYGRKLETD